VIWMARSRAKDYDDERQIILHRSAQLFAESRYVGTSMNMVADGCRVSKAQRRLKTNFREISGPIDFRLLQQYLQNRTSPVCRQSIEEVWTEPQRPLGYRALS
jgi:hypothetical protein